MKAYAIVITHHCFLQGYGPGLSIVVYNSERFLKML